MGDAPAEALTRIQNIKDALESSRYKNSKNVKMVLIATGSTFAALTVVALFLFFPLKPIIGRASNFLGFVSILVGAIIFFTATGIVLTQRKQFVKRANDAIETNNFTELKRLYPLDVVEIMQLMKEYDIKNK